LFCRIFQIFELSAGSCFFEREEPTPKEPEAMTRSCFFEREELTPKEPEAMTGSGGRESEKPGVKPKSQAFHP